MNTNSFSPYNYIHKSVKVLKLAPNFFAKRAPSSHPTRSLVGVQLITHFCKLQPSKYTLVWRFCCGGVKREGELGFRERKWEIREDDGDGSTSRFRIRRPDSYFPCSHQKKVYSLFSIFNLNSEISLHTRSFHYFNKWVMLGFIFYVVIHVIENLGC